MTGVTATASAGGGNTTPDTVLKAGGTLTLAADVNVGGNNLLLWTTTGNVVEPEPPNAGGIITAAGLAVDAAGQIDLQQANAVGTLAAVAHGGGITFNDTTALTVGSVTTVAPSDNETVTGVTATAAAGVGQPDAGYGAEGWRDADAGGRRECRRQQPAPVDDDRATSSSRSRRPPAGSSRRAGLAVDAAGHIDLQQANAGGNAAAVAHGGGITFNDTTALTVGSVTTVAPSDNETVTGVTATAAGGLGNPTPDTVLKAGGTLTLAADVECREQQSSPVDDDGQRRRAGAADRRRHYHGVGLGGRCGGSDRSAASQFVGTLGAVAHGGGITFNDTRR